MVYPALLPLMRTPRLPVVDWTGTPADLNGLVRFAERRDLVSTPVCHHISTGLYHQKLRIIQGKCITGVQHRYAWNMIHLKEMMTWGIQLLVMCLQNLRVADTVNPWDSQVLYQVCVLSVGTKPFLGVSRLNIRRKRDGKPASGITAWSL